MKKNWRRLTAGMYTANHEIWRGSVVVWGCIFCEGIGPTKVEGRMNGKDYIDFYLDTCFPTCSQWDLDMCLWMTMPHAINLRQ